MSAFARLTTPFGSATVRRIYRAPLGSSASASLQPAYEPADRLHELLSQRRERVLDPRRHFRIDVPREQAVALIRFEPSGRMAD